ncbi:LysM peptidoglycan-binding domain-containing protein [Vibrio maerlii]|uniref:LysM peptidoglycan-binding domain-containing protein n=1 Tax=Vibrio maerlii TaxID=2231648 RepID=UPI0013E094F1|nr:LysM peptidoglycan-binding domain-containing protein [Vibrio maerlii]
MLRLAHCFLGALLSISSLGHASEQIPLSVKYTAPKSYVVEQGDTLWGISALYLDSPWLWPQLWHANPRLDNPHLIYPGDQLNLIWLDGQPVLSVKSVKKLSPQVRISHKQAPPTLEQDLVLPYLPSDRLLAKPKLDKASRIIGASHGRSYLATGDTVYIDGVHRHKLWSIYRLVTDYVREESGEDIVVLKQVAKAHSVTIDGKMSALKIGNQIQEVRLNDIAIPDLENDPLQLGHNFAPQPVPKDMTANILGSIEGNQYLAAKQVVVIDRGFKDGVKQGSMFDLMDFGTEVFESPGGYQYAPNLQSSEIHLPSHHVGSMMVIIPYESFSLALITRSKRDIDRGFLAVSPLRSNQQTDYSIAVTTNEREGF